MTTTHKVRGFYSRAESQYHCIAQFVSTAGSERAWSKPRPEASKKYNLSKKHSIIYCPRKKKKAISVTEGTRTETPTRMVTETARACSPSSRSRSWAPITGNGSRARSEAIKLRAKAVEREKNDRSHGGNDHNAGLLQRRRRPKQKVLREMIAFFLSQPDELVEHQKLDKSAQMPAGFCSATPVRWRRCTYLGNTSCWQPFVLRRVTEGN